MNMNNIKRYYWEDYAKYRDIKIELEVENLVKESLELVELQSVSVVWDSSIKERVIILKERVAFILHKFKLKKDASDTLDKVITNVKYLCDCYSIELPKELCDTLKEEVVSRSINPIRRLLTR